MKLCIPLRAPMPDGANDAHLEPYFPRARYLYLYDTETDCGRTLDLTRLAEEEGGFRIDAVLCTSLDRKTLRQLQERQIPVYGTDADTFRAALDQYLRGELIAAESEPESSGCGGGCGKSGGCGSHGGSADADTSEEAARQDLRIALCSQNRKTLTAHAGKCRKFWIYTVRDGIVQGRDLLELPLEQSWHATPDSAAHPLDDVDVLIAGSMGSGLQARLRARGIMPRVSELSDLDAAVAAYLAGEMPASDQDAEPVAAPRKAGGAGCGGGCGGHTH